MKATELLDSKLPNVDQPARRLSKEDWAVAGTHALAHHGIDGVRVEQLAKDLRVTKGSFYWHFKDREELCDAILERWRRQNTIDVVDAVGSLDDPRQKLERLIRMPFEISIADDSMRLALSLRLWARNDEKVARVVQEVDALRVRMMTQLLRAIGHSNDEAKARSVLAYAYMRVALSVIERENTQLQEQCEAILLGEVISQL